MDQTAAARIRQILYPHGMIATPVPPEPNRRWAAAAAILHRILDPAPADREERRDGGTDTA